MFLMLSGFLMPVLLVFGLYHLLTWVDVFSINSRAFWKRVGFASAISHILLTIGFFVFSYIDYRLNQTTTFAGLGFDAYLFNRSEFWRLTAIFDTAPMLALVAVAAALDKVNWNPGGMVPLAIAVIFVVGTLQWYWVGGAVGVLVERFWTGLKTAQQDDEEWFG
jgi:hypothetical protein